MNQRPLRGLSVAVLAFTSAASLSPTMAADTPLPGASWEVTSQPTMEGMPPGMQMPVFRTTQCVAKSRTTPPVAANPRQSCSSSNYQQSSDGKVTWAMQCTGPSMTGTGEIRYAADRKSYTGLIRFIGAQGNMTINLTGTKGADCANPQQ